jgi:hypothetical protein
MYENKEPLYSNVTIFPEYKRDYPAKFNKDLAFSELGPNVESSRQELLPEEEAFALQRTSSVAPLAIFVPVGFRLWKLYVQNIHEVEIEYGNKNTEIVEFLISFDDIQKRTTNLHKELIEKGKKYNNEKENACVAWSIRALGIIDDDYMCQSRDKRILENIGLHNHLTCKKLNQYLDNQLLVGIFTINIDELFKYLIPGSATLISIVFNSINHVLLVVKTDDSPEDPEYRNKCILYDPSGDNSKKQILSYIGNHELDTKKSHFSDYFLVRKWLSYILCFGREKIDSNADRFMTIHGTREKLSVPFGGRKSKRIRKNRRKSKRRTRKSKRRKTKKYMN